ncbi:hypothetical protein PoB_007524200 [Plakobranchus ocellatus]|uniref:Uncharacterized protein n=1 Tax=Plakobranchus ocellatus TaxID=259542 RepID=A0AAV4DWQ4_9GAST|nr:hypothetical protein PoB_007524200 [Plakobranchus ocellatus]
MQQIFADAMRQLVRQWQMCVDRDGGLSRELNLDVPGCPKAPDWRVTTTDHRSSSHCDRLVIASCQHSDPIKHAPPPLFT